MDFKNFNKASSYSSTVNYNVKEESTTINMPVGHVAVSTGSAESFFTHVNAYVFQLATSIKNRFVRSIIQPELLIQIETGNNALDNCTGMMVNSVIENCFNKMVKGQDEFREKMADNTRDNNKRSYTADDLVKYFNLWASQIENTALENKLYEMFKNRKSNLYKVTIALMAINSGVYNFNDRQAGFVNTYMILFASLIENLFKNDPVTLSQINEDSQVLVKVRTPHFQDFLVQISKIEPLRSMISV